MGVKEQIMQFLKEQLDKHGGRKATLARACGVDAGTLGRWLNGKRVPNLNEIGPALDALGFTFALADGIAQSPQETPDRSCLVPVVNAVAGAGESYETGKNIAGYYAFSADVLQHLCIRADDAIMMRVRGDSMQPLILDGDMLLLDPVDTTIHDGCLYVFHYEALMVKRVQRLIDGIVLRSENPAYSAIEVRGDEINKLNIVGRVRWYSRIV